MSEGQKAEDRGQTGQRANGQTGKPANGLTGQRADGQTGKPANRPNWPNRPTAQTGIPVFALRATARHAG
ncbi:hypothetical protein D3OALGB2SA_3324 [Olavius algarvensis associated proteobacterium Delta 3]|nr:hypothetical protein D3OALGB2SA_3324 [Olavius algarvensis associated proteobacterium Delta 3]